MANYHENMTYWVIIHIPLHTKVFRQNERLDGKIAVRRQMSLAVHYLECILRYLFD